MKIAVDCRMIWRSGIGTVLRELLPIVLRSGHHFVLLGDPSRLCSYSQMGAEVIRFDAPIYSLSEQITFPRRLLKQVDVLLFPHYNVPVMLSVPLVVVVHDLAPLALPDVFKGVAKQLYAQLFFRVAAKGAARVIAVSHFTRQEMVNRLGADPTRIRVVHNGPGRAFPEGSRSDSLSLHRYGIVSPYLLAVGNLKPHKNLRTLVDAFAILKHRGYGTLNLVIAGRSFPGSGEEGDLFGLSRERLREIGVILTGFVSDEDMPALYRNASFLVLPSIYEGFGLTALEALRFDTLSLVADAASLPEVIDDPDLRFDPSAALALAEKIVLFLEDPDLVATKVASQKKNLGRFSWEGTARGYLDVLEEVGRRV